MTVDLNGWERLICGYFNEACVDQLSKPLAEEGFAVSQVKPFGTVVFKRFDVFLEIGYEMEPGPQFVTVVIGFGPELYSKVGLQHHVPLWFVIGEEHPAIRYSSCTFTSEVELRAVLLRIKAEVIDAYCRPLWEHTEELERRCAEFRAWCETLKRR